MQILFYVINMVKQELKWSSVFCLQGPQTCFLSHVFKGCHSDVRRSCSPPSVWGNKCQERLSTSEGSLRAFVWEKELNPTQEMNVIMKHNVRRANPMNAICPQSLEHWLETPKKGEQLIRSLCKVGFLLNSVINWWMELFCITAVICFFGGEMYHLYLCWVKLTF